MPNHIHGIINIVGGEPCLAPDLHNQYSKNDQINNKGQTHGSAPTIPRIIQWFKTMTTNQYIRYMKNNNSLQFQNHLWQRNYYDHLIRNDKLLDKIRQYIANNPQTWDEDEHNIKNYSIKGKACLAPTGQF